jgi:hypothetical protein
MKFQLPKKDKRTTIVGSTGSGKTYLALWLLSTRDFHIRPWFIIDYKRDRNIAELSVHQNPPMKAGLYVIRPLVETDDLAVEQFLWKVWANENAGLYFDEGYMLHARHPAMNALLTQGRSKYIEMIILVQRPVWCNKFYFSEANHFYVMKLTNGDDRKYMGKYLDGTQIDRLPRFRSYWYDADEQEGAQLLPVPNLPQLLEVFERRLVPNRRMKRAI